MHDLLVRRLRHLKVNPVVIAIMLADTILWSAWNLTGPIFAVFMLTQIKGGTVEAAATGYSIYLIGRVIFELLSAKFLMGKSDTTKFIVTVVGMVSITIAYIGFAYSPSVFSVFFFYFVLGGGIGFATPAKSSLFATHLDHKKEATECGVTDAVAYVAMAGTTILGGVISTQWGFTALFLIAAAFNLAGVIPYLRFIPSSRRINLFGSSAER